jgi:hypothetical protein
MNQSLSERRANAVRITWLNRAWVRPAYHLRPRRSSPVADNESAAGQQNRRVEVVISQSKASIRPGLSPQKRLNPGLLGHHCNPSGAGAFNCDHEGCDLGGYMTRIAIALAGVAGPVSAAERNSIGLLPSRPVDAGGQADSASVHVSGAIPTRLPSHGCPRLGRRSRQHETRRSPERRQGDRHDAAAGGGWFN